jgi:hypothetical protein
LACRLEVLLAAYLGESDGVVMVHLSSTGDLFDDCRLATPLRRWRGSGST